SADIELGTCSGPVASFVDPDEVVAFALAINDANPRYLGGTAVPPTYVVTPSLPVYHALAPHSAAVLAGASAEVHGEHDFVIHRPITPGMRLHVTAERVGAAPTKAGMTVVHAVRAHDDAGQLLVEQLWTAMLIGAATGEPRGTPVSDHAFPEEARDRLVGR